MSTNSSYADYTYNTKNILARFSHRKRFDVGIYFVSKNNCTTLLDYGSGDNMFLKELHLVNKNISLFAFEPVMEVTFKENIQTFTDLKEFKNQKFDTITCFEVLEHFNEKEQLDILNQIQNSLNNNGNLIVSVPIETGIPSLVKNIRRMNFKEQFLKKIGYLFKSFFGLNIPELRNQEGYIYAHTGFNHKRLEKILYQKFSLVSKETSPFKKLPVGLNSQVFYHLKNDTK